MPCGLPYDAYNWLLDPVYPPSYKPTPSPTTTPDSTLIFTSNITITGLTSTTLQTADQQTIVNATATAMGISMNYVKYTGSKQLTAAKKLNAQAGTGSVLAYTQVVYPVPSTSSASIYSELTTALYNSVQSGTYTAYLRTASTAYGATATADATATSVQSSTPMVVADNNDDDDSPILSTPAIIGIAVGGAAFLALIVGIILYFTVYKKTGGASHATEAHTSTNPMAEAVDKN
jgi:hypothetical protein